MFACKGRLIAAVVSAALLTASPAFAETDRCVYNATPPTFADGQSPPLQCDANGNLKAVASGTPSGTQDVNLAKVNGVTTSTGTGAVGTGTARVAVGTDTATIAGSAPGTAGSASANVVTVQGVASMTPVQSTPVVGTTGGATASFLQPTASDNHANIKNGAGTLYGAVGFNNSVTINYLRYYNAGSGFNGCNSATNLIAQFQIPPSGGYSIQVPVGIAFSTGLSICVTSGYATTDTTNATASAMSITTLYN